MAHMSLRSEGNEESTDGEICRRAFHAEDSKERTRGRCKETCRLDLRRRGIDEIAMAKSLSCRL